MKTQVCEIESLGAAPVGWKAAKLKYHAELNPKCGTQVTEDAEVTFTPMENVKNGYFIPGKEKYERFAGNSQYAEYEEGDIAFAKVTPCFENDNIAIMQGLVNGKGFGSSELFVIRPFDIGLKYLFYLLQNPHFKANGVASMTGTGGLKRVSSDAVRNYRFALPSAGIQNLIASYLDTKCAEIDKVVEQTRATIDEYKKLKQAIITEAVTKGVRGSRTMKPSGVEWIGDIPEGWKKVSLKYLCRMNAGDSLSSLDILPKGDYPVYGGNGLRGFYSSSNCKGPIILIGRQGALCGNVHLVDGDFWATEHAVITRFTPDIFMQYGYYLLVAMNLGQYVSPSAAQPGLSVSKISSITATIPSISEQQEIATYLDTKCAEIDRIIEKKEQLIEELGSYKKSLIYEYVTGKKEVTA